jgi:hypothetical protein
MDELIVAGAYGLAGDSAQPGRHRHNADSPCGGLLIAAWPRFHAGGRWIVDAVVALPLTATDCRPTHCDAGPGPRSTASR